MSAQYTIGLDYGTNSVRALIVNVANGAEVAAAVWTYAHGTQGVILSRDPNLARQHPADYVNGAEITIKQALAAAKKSVHGFSADQVIGIGVDTTGSTPLPVDANGQPLAFQKKFTNHPAAMAWLWKDHTGVNEAAEITALAKKMRPQFLAKCGGTYSSEWFWSKILHCLRTAPEVFNAAHAWVEFADYVPADAHRHGASGQIHRRRLRRGAQGHVERELGWLSRRAVSGQAGSEARRSSATGCTTRVHSIDRAVGGLTAEWAKRTGLPAGIPVAVGAFDAHLGAVGSGVAPGTLVKIIGTSTCDIAISPNTKKLADVPGLCGIVDGSVLPGYFGLEAGQSAVGDIFNWFVNYIQARSGEPRPACTTMRRSATTKTSRRCVKLQPGESGLLALDWNNGNRTILVDQRLTGLLARPDAVHDAGGNLPRAHRGDGVRRADHHQSLRGIRREDFVGRQLRRHRGEKPARHANLRGRDGSADESQPLGANLRARFGHRGGGRGGRAQRLRHGAEADDRPEADASSSRTPKRTRPTRNFTRSTSNCTTPSARRRATAICMA